MAESYVIADGGWSKISTGPGHPIESNGNPYIVNMESVTASGPNASIEAGLAFGLGKNHDAHLELGLGLTGARLESSYNAFPSDNENGKATFKTISSDFSLRYTHNFSFDRVQLGVGTKISADQYFNSYIGNSFNVVSMPENSGCIAWTDVGRVSTFGASASLEGTARWFAFGKKAESWAVTSTVGYQPTGVARSVAHLCEDSVPVEFYPESSYASLGFMFMFQ